MLSFTVCWVIPREWRGWKTSRFRPLAEETTHIYIFLSSLQAQSRTWGTGSLFHGPRPCAHCSRTPVPGSGLGGTNTHNLHRLQQQGLVPTASQEPLWSQIRLRGEHGAPLTAPLSSPPPIPCPGAHGQAPGQAGTSGATRNGTSVPIKTHHYVKIHIEIWIDRLDKNGS